MRVCLLLLVVAGCQSALTDAGGGNKGSGSGSNGVLLTCQLDSECALVGAKCCDCPTFAASVDDPAVRACDGVACPQMPCPTNARAACEGNVCVVACIAMPCATTCPEGFVIDPNGCLECACAGAPSAQCRVDTDCVRTRADCCGCPRGGKDTAMPATEAASFDASLMCPSNPQCSDVDTCPVGLEPRCIQGACELAPPTPPGACGRPDLPPCPTGQTCTINTSDAATQQGVGVCM